MANEIKFGNKVVFLNGNPILLPSRVSDPGSGNTSGDMIWRSDLSRVRVYNGTIWESLATGTVVTDHGALSGLSDDDHSQYALLAGRSGGQTVVGGTDNSSNLILRSTSAGTKGQVFIDETTASTSSTSGALRVAGGVGIALDLFVAGDVDTAALFSPTLDRATTGTLSVGGANTTQVDVGNHANTTTANIVTGAGNKTINLGTGNDTNTINIGGSGSTVNIGGTLQYVQTTNLQVSDKLITINKGGAASSGDGSGLEIEEDSAITGFIKVSDSRSSWDLKAPLAGANSRIARITPPTTNFTGILVFGAPSANRTYTLPDASGTVALTSDLGSYVETAGDAMTGALTMNAQNELRLADSDSSNHVALRGAATIASNYTITLPAAAPGSDTFLKFDGTDYAWASAGTGSVSAGVAGRLSLYPTSSDNVDDVYTQNSQAIDIAIAAQPTRSAGITYTIPNPGDALTAASFVLTEGAQTINGGKTFGNNISFSGNNTVNIGSDAAEANTIWARAISHNDVTNPNLEIGTTGNNGSVILTAHGTGNLDVLATKIRRTENGAGSNYFEDQYFDALTLTANIATPTEISASLSFAAASYAGAIINYSMIEATTGKTRVGQFIVSTTSDGAIVSGSDQFSETAALGAAAGLQLDADFDTGNVRIRFNHTAAAAASTMRAHIRKFRA